MGIRVGRRVVNIPPTAFAYDPSTGAGTVIDSGTVFTVLVKPAYTAVRDEVRRQMGNATVSSLGSFDTCYTVPVTVPTVTFMFQELNMSLPQDNFLIRSSSGTTSCLAMASAPDTSVNSVLNVSPPSSSRTASCSSMLPTLSSALRGNHALRVIESDV